MKQQQKQQGSKSNAATDLALGSVIVLQKVHETKKVDETNPSPGCIIVYFKFSHWYGYLPHKKNNSQTTHTSTAQNFVLTFERYWQAPARSWPKLAANPELHERVKKN